MTIEYIPSKSKPKSKSRPKADGLRSLTITSNPITSGYSSPTQSSCCCKYGWPGQKTVEILIKLKGII